MPELPEVETRVRELRPLCQQQTIIGVRAEWERHLSPLSFTEFSAQVLGQTILGLTRRAKYLVFELTNGALLVHLRMSGDLAVVAHELPYQKHDHTALLFASGSELRFNDARKFGRMTWVENSMQATAHLGPEPLADDFTPARFYEMLQNTQRALKPLLLDQAFLAGVGNIYCDESLHAAKIHPLRRSNSLSEAEATRLWASIRQALQDGIRRNGASIDWVYRGGSQQHHFAVYGRSGQHCPTCGAPIVRTVVGQRGTHYCPQCQPFPEETDERRA